MQEDAIRVNITLKREQLQRLDEMAASIGKKRSAMVAFMVDGLGALESNKEWTRMIEALVKSTVDKIVQR